MQIDIERLARITGGAGRTPNLQQLGGNLGANAGLWAANNLLPFPPAVGHAQRWFPQAGRAAGTLAGWATERMIAR